MSQPFKLALTTPSALSDPSRTIPKGQHNIPRFLLKLYEIVNDPANESLTKWSEAGDSFYIFNQERFAREVLGKWFKHQNFSSFVRQLNLYGFRKISALQQGLLRMDNESETIQFAHPHFHRGQPDLLAFIQRKRHPASHAQAEDNAVSLYQRSLSHEGKDQNQAVDMHAIVEGINSIRRQQQTIAADLTALKQSNDALWKEAIEARGRHAKHEETINRILKFLAGLFGRAIHQRPDQSHSEGKSAPSRRLMIGDGREIHGEGGDYFGNDVDGLTDARSRSHTPLSFASERFAAVDTPGASIAELQESISKSPPKLPQSFPEVRQQEQVTTSTASQLPPLPVDAPSNVLSSNTTALQPQVPNPEAMWQATLQQIMTSPSHFQRVMQAFTKAQPYRTPADQGSDALGLFSSVNPAPPEQLAYPIAALSAPTEQLSLPPTANPGAQLTVAPASASGFQETALADNAQRINKTYHRATEIDADMDALQSNIDSLICEMGLDPDNIAFPTVVSSPPSAASPSSVGGIDQGASDFSFDQWLHEITNADSANPSTSKKPLSGSSATGNLPGEDLSATLDIPMLGGPPPAPSAALLTAVSGAAPLGSPTGVKRKVNVVEVSDVPLQDAPSTKRKR